MIRGDEQHVGAGRESLLRRLRGASLRQRSHGQAVGDDHTLKGQMPANDAANDRRGQRSWTIMHRVYAG